MTVTTSSSSYCTGATFLNFYDERIVGDLLSADGNRVASVSGNAKLADMLLAASGEVEAACLPGKRYTPTDLAALTGASRKLLDRTVAALAMQFVREFHAQSAVEPLPCWKRAQDILEKLRLGEYCFGFVEVQEAGFLAAHADTYDQRVIDNGVVFQARAVFGNRTWTKKTG